jgi:hypothetical protein
MAQCLLSAQPCFRLSIFANNMAAPLPDISRPAISSIDWKHSGHIDYLLHVVGLIANR